MKTNPEISIIIPTLNSEKTLSLTLNSIYKQTLKKEKYEVLIIDGGSQDQTLSIARKFNAKIIDNPYKTPEMAKAIGMKEARGKDRKSVV